MKKVILLLMITAVMFSCKKNETTTVQPEQNYAEVSFNVNQIFPEVDREDYPFGLPECSDTDPVYAHIVIMKSDLTTLAFEGDIDLFTLPFDPNLYTQAIKLMLDGCDHVAGGDACCNDFYVTQFMVYDAQDDLIYAAPLDGSDAQGWLDYPDRQLDLLIHICEFTKYQYDIDVLCYEEAWYLEFGFVWFNVHEVVLCEVCFFGDICFNEYPFFEGVWTPYSGAWDMPAIFYIYADKWTETSPGVWEWVQVDAYFDDDTGEPIFTNASWNGIGDPLCVPFADYKDKEDKYKILIDILMPTGPLTMDYVPYHFTTLLVIDDCDYSELDLDGNGVIEFVIGNCNVEVEQGGSQYYYATREDGAITPLY